jgi:uncharacterized protein YbaR (Trm112 family)
MLVCPACNKPIRYINAAHTVEPDGIFVVDAEPQTLISEKGRVISGYREHQCTGAGEGVAQ